jgi:hypothetical protein
LARCWWRTAGVVLLACVLVLALFVHLSRRSDLLEDVLAAPPSGEANVAPLKAATTTYPLSRTPVRRAGDVALRLSLRGGGAAPSAFTIRILGPRQELLATCRYASGTLRDTNVMRCPVRNLALVRRVRITLNPEARGLGVIGSKAGVGTLLVPRSHTLLGRLGTVIDRLGAKHPAPFSAWLVPLGTVIWLASLGLVALSVAGESPDSGDDEAA